MQLAVCAWDASFTYHELDQLSEQLAHRLVDLGVRPEVLVPLCFNKSAWTVVSMLAVLKAGGACVGLDPAHPKRRLEEIISRTQAQVIVAAPQHQHLFDGLVHHVVSVQASLFREEKQFHKAKPVLSSVTSTNTAFVLFTSGSTGTPKGIVIEHGSFCTSSRAHGTQWHIGPGTRVLQFAAHTFDVSNADVFTTITRGGCVCIPSDHDRSNNLAGVITSMNVNWTFLTPTVARLLKPSEVPSLQTLVLGGEASTTDNIQTWARDVELIICYGPAECSIYCAGSTPAQLSSSPSNVGHAIGASLWITEVSDHNKLTPIGCVGELLIEGRIVAREYLHDEEKTNAAFIRNPAWLKDDSRTRRLYKTGDLARFMPDGTVCIIGRKDAQVKLRGQRIELGEIEYHIKIQLKSSDAIVEMIRPADRPEKPFLAAFFSGIRQTENVPTQSTDLDELLLDMCDELRTDLIQLEMSLSEVLPSYMVPSLYMPLKKMPMTASGKRDRRRLQNMAQALSSTQKALYGLSEGNNKRAPSTEMEQKLQSLWEVVLTLTADSSIGVEDSFFRLGGDSIGAMRLVALARAERIKLTVADIFRYPRLHEMAKASIALSEDDDDVQEAVSPFTLLSDGKSTLGLLMVIASQCGVENDSIQDAYPCTALQEGFLALSVKQPGAYLAQNVFRIPDTIDLDRFQKAWESTVETTDILRTRIVYTPTMGSLQVVLRENITWCTSDSLDEYLLKGREAPVRYGGPLVHYALIAQENKERGNELYFVWTAHHAIYDGGSLPLILEKVAQAYKDSSTAQLSSFNGFIKHLTDMDINERDEYWRLQLRGANQPGFPIIQESSDLHRAEKSMIRKMALPIAKNGSNITIPTVIRTAWATVIANYTETEDVVFGAVLTGRNAPVPGMAQIIGPTITTVPVRIRLSRDQTVSSLLENVQLQATDMIPFEHTGLQNIRRLGADEQAACDFRTLLLVQPRPRTRGDEGFESLGLEGVLTDQTDFHTYPLVLGCYLADGIIEFEVFYDINVIPMERMECILYQFEHVIRQLIVEPSDSTMTAGDVDMFSPHDKAMVRSWNRIQPQAVNACVHEMVEEQVLIKPNAVAVCGWDISFTYSQLDQLSQQLAHHLVCIGVGPEILVPLCFEKSAWAIVAMLAVLKAGGACVALNPAHPIERLQSIIHDAGAKIILTAPQFANMLGTISDSVVTVDASSIYALPLITEKACAMISPNNPGFVVFTSGSTGKPKGIVLEHRALCTSALAHGTAMRIEGSRVLQFAAYTFDVSIGEIFTTLIFGGCVCVPSEQDRMQNLAKVINDMKVDWAYLTPTVATLLHPSEVPALKTLCLGGEALKQESVSLWADYVYLINIYGPAETTIWSTALTGLRPDTSAANIGRGIGALMWIVDIFNRGRLCPVGCVGELWIEGPILARGYLGDPAKTNAAFIENPTWLKQYSSRTTRMYKTGDLVRYNTNGTIDFVGRKDTQVKFHGQRIELGEIEHHLKPELSILGVSDVAVEMVKPSGSPEDAILVAFYYGDNVSNDNSGDLDSLILDATDDVRGQLVRVESVLAQTLPPYMIPSMYIPLRHMPMTVSGKCDRRKLRESLQELPSAQLGHYRLAGTEKRPPSTAMEIKIQKLWGDVLGLANGSIGADDSFFQLGGDSIRAMRLVSVARTEMILISVADIFRHPRLYEMATAAVVTSEHDNDHDVLAPFSLLKTDNTDDLLAEIATQCAVDKSRIQDAYPCTPLQEGLLALSTKQLGAYVAQNVFRLPSTINLESFRAAWEAVVNATDILRTRVVYTQTMGSFQIVLEDSITWKSAADLDSYLAEDLQIPITYGGALVRYTLISNGGLNDENYFVWTAHHALYDGGSLPMILEKVAQVYQGDSIVPSPPFNSFIEYLQAIDVNASDDYWQSQLSGASPPAFPARLSSAGPERVEKSLFHRVDLRKQSERLGSNKTSFTKSTLIRAAWAIVLARYSDTKDAVFGVTLAGRNAPVNGMAKIIGPTITTVPLRILIDPSQTVVNYLETLQIQAADMIPFEHTGLQNIRRLGSDAQAACDFRNLLVVQPGTRTDNGSAALGLKGVKTLQTGFHTYPLVIECNLGDEVIDINVLYDTDVIPTKQMERVVYHLDHVIQQLNVAPGDQKTLGSVEMFTSHDMADLCRWSSSQQLEVMETCVHEVFKQQLSIRPDAEAVCAWDAKFSYRELDVFSGQLAHQLVRVGVGPEVLVPHCFSKSAWTIVAMLAVLKAGGACVGLDPTHPKRRLKELIGRTRAQVIVAAPQHCHLFDGLVQHVIPVEASLFTKMPRIARRLPQRVVSTNTAFVLFTSGSTGTPKGIVIEHGSLCTSSQAHGTQWHIGPGTRVLQFAAHTFDVSVADMFTTIMRGGCVCVPSEHDRSNNLAGAIRDMNVNWTFLTPTVARLLRPSEVPCLKTLVLGGEASTKDNIQTWANDVELIICYGPAECSIYCAGSVPADQNSDPSNVGHAIGSSFWVTETANHDKLTPIGCVGELLIEGRIVAREYLHDEEKTTAAFIENPAWAREGSEIQSRRLYKTGDLARFNSDGTLCIVGRKDAQVKLRGQRIELGEIEHHIKIQLKSSGATDAIVEMIRPVDRPDAPFLAAFISGVMKSDSNELVVEISDELRTQLLKLESVLIETLPSYMIPALYIPLDRMPLTTSGKRDRRKLQELAQGLSTEQVAHYGLSKGAKRAPSTDIEKKLQWLWGSVLGLPENSIGVDDNFFRIGGDSITAMRLVAAARTKMTVLTVADIFRHPRLCEMASVVVEEFDRSKSSKTVAPFSLLNPDVELDDLLDEIAIQCGIEKADVQDVYPCTPLQEGLLALSVRQSGAYVAQNVFRLSSLETLDLDRFCDAWEATIKTTDILRTRIVYTRNQGSLQVVVDDAITWESASSLERYLAEGRAAPHTYGGSLVRYALVQDETQGGNLYFVWTTHHALYDGGSLPLILEKVSRLYEERSVVISSPPFNHFIKYLQDNDPAACDEYWKSQLAGVSRSSFLELPSSAGLKRVEKSLIREVDLSAYNGGSNVTRPTLIRAAWAMVVAQYSGTNDVVFGVTLTGRNAPVADMERIIGPTITTVPVRVRLDYSQSVQDLLHTLQIQATEMISFEHTGIQNIRRLGSDAQAACDFQNLLVVQPRAQMSDEKGNEALSLEQIVTHQADFHTYPLVVECNLDDGKIEIEANYDTNTISPQQISRVIYQFEHFIRQLSSATAEQTLGNMQVLNPQDKQQIWAWNSVELQAEEHCVHNVFEQQVTLRENADAVCGWDANFSYRELDRISNQLAHHLVTLGVGPEVLVPLCFDKSAWTIVAMLAVLKAGGACVALNPAHPIERLQGIINDVGATTVIIAPAHKNMFEGILDHAVILDRLLFEALPTVTTVACSTVQPSNPGFVVFTSGSTGKPKGIVLEHRALCTSAREHGAAMRIRPTSRVLQFAAYTFDVSIGEIFTTLMRGGCVCVPSEKDRMDNLAGAINAMRVNWAYLTPTVATLLQPYQVPTLRTLSLGGEALKQESVSLWADDVYLINIYGPAETTIWSTCLTSLSSDTSAANIGRGIGALMWIVDASNHDRLCPIGCVGELLIEGPILARGYLNDAAKTKAAFIENPEWLKETDQTRRLYKTGDLVRYNYDGTIDFIGRKDTQVKLYGQRIEMGEIEHHLKPQLKAYGLADVVVELVRPLDRPEDALLAAFFSGHALSQAKNFMENTSDIQILSISEAIRENLLRAESLLMEALPSYMIPSVYIPVDRLPTTVSGKLDRKKLRQLAAELSSDKLAGFGLADGEKRGASTDMEKKLQIFWADILGVKDSSIGADDSFFRLGGDSIGAMKLVTAARTNGITLSVADVFRCPRLCEMAAAATFAEEDDTPEIIPPFALLKDADNRDRHIEEAARQCEVDMSTVRDVYPCTPLQEGLLALSVKEPGSYVAQNIFQLPSAINLDRFCDAWAAVVKATDILRTRIVYMQALGSLQVVLDETIQWQSAATLEGYLSKDREILIGFGGPLARYGLVKDSSQEDKHYFIWTAHHALFDGGSLPVILQRVTEAYEGESIIQRSSFNGFIKYLNETDIVARDEYWKSQLDGASPPTFPKGPLSIGHKKEILSKEMHMSNNIDGSSVTRSNVIKAAWAMIVARYSETDDAVFGLTLTGRNAPVKGISKIIGPMITTVPVRVLVDNRKSARGFLEDVQLQSINMIPFEHTGIQNIRQLGPSAKAACDFRNLLVIQPRGSAESDTNIVSLGLGSVNHRQADFHTYPLVVECNLDQEKVVVEAQYDLNTISTQQMDTILCQFEHVMRQMSYATSNWKTKVGDIEMVSPQELSKILSWNRVKPQAVDACVHDIVAQQVARQPEATAICAWDANFTYIELNRLSDQLAYYLMGIGVKPEVLVPLCFDKSAWTVVAMLAVLKAGGACVALNPQHPIDRLQGIIRDTSAKVILTSPAYREMFDGVDYIIAVGASFLGKLPVSDTTVCSTVQPSNPSFVVFTSGSTGKPKGIILEHRALCTSAREHGAAMCIGPTSRVLQFAAYTFDVSIGEIFTTLMHGGCVCVPSEQDRMENLAGVINAMKVDWAYLTPTVAALLQPSQVPTLRTLSLGGEAVKPENVSVWADHVYLINIYGPAETTIWSTALTGLHHQTSAANIGRGIGALMWVTDVLDHNRLCPIGCVGELLIEGPILARGYLNDAVKTAASFIENPAWLKQESGGSRRLYKTGDLVRYNPDGTLDFIGRRDTQVKLRGQRIELGEIEHHIAVDTNVRQTAVVVPKSGYCEARLVAIISSVSLTSTPQLSSDGGIRLLSQADRDSAAPWISKLTEPIKEQLPSYMIPTTWILVEKLPATTSGKLDRKVIRQWVENLDEDVYQQITTVAIKDVSPMTTTGTEAKIRQLWSTVLNLPIHLVTMSHSFLSLGGDSITAMQLVSLFRTENIGRITVKDVLQSKNIGELASCVASLGKSRSMTDEVNTPFDLSPIQQLYFAIAPKANTLFHQCLVLRVTKTIKPETLTRAIDSIVQHHSMLRSRFSYSEHGDWTQSITSDTVGSYRYKSHQLTEVAQMLPLATETQKSLDIEKGPLLGVDLYNIENGHQVLFMAAHHLVIDLVSWRIMLADLEKLLQGGALPEESPFPFQAWCKLQAEYARQHLSARNVLPYDIPPADYGYWKMTNKPNTYSDVVERSFAIDVATTSALLGKVHRALRTEPTDIFLAALIYSFGRTFPDRHIPPIFSEGHGREPWDADIDLSRTVGWFTTISPTYVPVKTGDNILEIVRRIKDTRRKLPKNGWPYFASRFLNPSGIDAFKNHWPMEILFNYQGLYQQLERDDSLLCIESLPTPDVGRDMERLALFDISVSVIGGAAQFSVIYNRKMALRSKVRDWMDAFESSLYEAVQCMESRALDYTLGDFPLLSMTYEGLENLKKDRLPRIGVHSLDEVEDVYSCSPMQEGILLSQQKSSGVYEIHHVSEILATSTNAPVSIDRLQSAWQKVVDRHSSLRTVFIKSISQEGLFDQIVLKKATASIKHIQCEDSEALAVLEAQPPLDHSEPRPLHQLILLETSAGRVFCKLMISHALTDASSNSILFQDFTSAYEATLSSEVGPLYRDYIAFVRALPLKESMKYWRGYLENVAPCSFPIINGGPAEEDRAKSIKLHVGSISELRNFSKEHGLTVNNIFLVVWGLVLRCYTSSDEVCFGYLSSGRDVPVKGIHDAVGAFINMLICRMDMSAENPLMRLLETVQADFMNSLQHQHCSLGKIQHSLGLSGQSLFNTVLSYQSAPSGIDGKQTEILFNDMTGQDPTEVSNQNKFSLKTSTKV